MLGATLAMALYAGLLAKPEFTGPQVSKADTKTEAERQLDFTLESRLRDYARLDRIAEQLLLANAELCPKTAGRTGLSVALINDFGKAIRPAASRRWGDTDRVVVTEVVAGSAAAAAGLLDGDQIVRLEGHAVAAGKTGLRDWEKRWTSLLETQPGQVTLAVERGGVEHQVTIHPTKGCAYDVVIDEESPDLNAYADGGRIVLTRSIIRLAGTDDELALVIGHELAHNARGHIKAKQRNARIGALGGLVLDAAVVAAGGAPSADASFTKLGAQIGGGAYSPEFESEADYFGTYYVARAGFRTENVELLWRRMAAENPRAILTKSSHPPTAQRYLAIAATRAEIARKQAEGLPLTPN